MPAPAGRNRHPGNNVRWPRSANWIGICPLVTVTSLRSGIRARHWLRVEHHTEVPVRDKRPVLIGPESELAVDWRHYRDIPVGLTRAVRTEEEKRSAGGPLVQRILLARVEPGNGKGVFKMDNPAASRLCFLIPRDHFGVATEYAQFV